MMERITSVSTRKLRGQRNANRALTLRSLMVLCVVFYAVLPSCTYCRCAGRYYAEIVGCCGAQRIATHARGSRCASRARQSCDACCRKRCASSCDDKRCAETCASSERRGTCCRYFLKSYYLGDEPTSNEVEVRVGRLVDPLEYFNHAYADLCRRRGVDASARLKPPLPLYLLLYVLRN